ncbi:hypothetical protein HU200_011056 [Digitaria exilis]|uniref:Wax synthase domain-containing protein n=1 Tax=Digitaria exilis TaxID=1010633 RepID=A0A835FHB1_9POAL|nr:hypothetical protein HU200_011056 [Digitaria exilis]
MPANHPVANNTYLCPPRSHSHAAMDLLRDSIPMVSLAVSAAALYARAASSCIRPGFPRLVALLPVVAFLAAVPLAFTSSRHPPWRRGLLLRLARRVQGRPLSLRPRRRALDPSLPVLPFLVTTALPIKLRPRVVHHGAAAPNSRSASLVSCASKAAVIAVLLHVYRFKEHLNLYARLGLYGVHMYCFADLLVAGVGIVAAGALGMEVQPQFDRPYMASSLRDFWGRRWNLVVPAILRPSVYGPVRARAGKAAGVMAAFFVSGLMHEVLVYYLTLRAPTGEMMAFFLLHGACCVAEEWGWPPPPPPRSVATTLVVVFVAATAFWLFFPPICRDGGEEVLLEEWAAVAAFFFGAVRSAHEATTHEHDVIHRERDGACRPGQTASRQERTEKRIAPPRRNSCPRSATEQLVVAPAVARRAHAGTVPISRGWSRSPEPQGAGAVHERARPRACCYAPPPPASRDQQFDTPAGKPPPDLARSWPLSISSRDGPYASEQSGRGPLRMIVLLEIGCRRGMLFRWVSELLCACNDTTDAHYCLCEAHEQRPGGKDASGSENMHGASSV